MKIDLNSKSADDFQVSIERKKSQLFYDSVDEFLLIYESYEAATGAVKKPFTDCYVELKTKYIAMNQKGESLTEREIQRLPHLKSHNITRDLKILKKILYPGYDFIVTLENMPMFADQVWALYLSELVTQVEFMVLRTLRHKELKLAKQKIVPSLQRAIALMRKKGASVSRASFSTRMDSRVHFEQHVEKRISFMAGTKKMV